MASITITKSYADGDILYEADLDNFKTDVETFLNTTKINDDNIQSAGITASTKLIDGTVTAGKLATDSVTTAKIADSNVTTVKIADSNVTTAKIADLNVTTGKLAASAVTTAKIADATVTRVKLEGVNSAGSLSCGSFSTTSTSFTDVTNLSASITATTDRPVMVMIQPVNTATPTEAYVGIRRTSGGTESIAYFQILRDNGGAGYVTVATFAHRATQGAGAETWSPLGLCFLDTPAAAGTYTWKVQIKTSDAGNPALITNATLRVFELG